MIIILLSIILSFTILIFDVTLYIIYYLSCSMVDLWSLIILRSSWRCLILMELL